MKKSQALNLLQERWKALAPREQNLVLAAASVIGLALIWWLALAPALNTLRTAPTRHAELDKQLQHMRSLQAQALELQKAPRAQSGEAVRLLQSSVTQQLGAGAQLNIVGDRATVTLKGVPAQRLGDWLAQVRNSARVVPLEAKLVRTEAANAPKTASAAGNASEKSPAHWDGTLVLSMPPT